jgi:glycosyltransferase involved in cell wall biosynthesis
MNPKVLHVNNAYSMGWTGGIDVTLKSLTTSDLANQYTFETVAPAQALAVCDRFKPDVIVVHDASSWKNLPWLWSLSRSAPLLINQHYYCENFEALNVSSIDRFRWMLKTAYGLAQRVISISEGQRAWMLRHQWVSEKKIFLIQSSRILDPFLTIPPKVRVVEEPFILGADGRFVLMKGFDLLIQATKPIIASAVDGLPEQIKNCGRLVRPKAPVALAQALQEFSRTSPATLAEMGEKRRKSVRFAWEHYLHQWQHLLGAVV